MINKLKKTSNISFFFVTLFICVILALGMNLTQEMQSENSPLDNFSLLGKFFVVVIITPMWKQYFLTYCQ